MVRSSKIRAVILAVIASAAWAQSAGSRSLIPGDTLPLKTTRTIQFTTQEGSWLSLDVSPDGQTIVFDLLGDLYLLPITGGTARRITSGPAVDAQPRFSPDGKRLVFLSDRDGYYNVWTCDLEGGTAQPVTHSRRIDKYLREFIQPQWLPDGQGIVVSHGTDPAYIDSKYDFEAVDLAGRPLAGIKVARAVANEDANAYTAAANFGDRGRALYATQYVGQRQGSREFEGILHQIVRIDPRTGERTQITSEADGAVQPLASPDGRYLAYVTKYPSGSGPKTGLKLLDLSSGRSSWLVSEIESSLQSSSVYSLFGMQPNAAFTPDSRAIVISYGGKLWRIAVPGGTAQQIPFTAQVEQHLSPLLRFPLKYDDAKLKVRIARDVRRSPDGRRLAFVALDRVWTMDLPRGKPKLLPSHNDAIEYSPAWSPDGRYLAYLTWTDHGGYAYRVSTSDFGTGAVYPEALTTKPGFYDKLSYSPDGQTLVMVCAPWQSMLNRSGGIESGSTENKNLALIEIPAGGGLSKTLMNVETPRVDLAYGWPHFSQRDPARVFFFVGGTLWAVKRDGSGRDAVAQAQLALDLLLSPQGDRALLTEGANAVVSVVEIPPAVSSHTVPFWPDEEREKAVHLLTPRGGEFPWWSADGRSFSYSLGHAFFTYDLRGLSTDAARRQSYEPDRLDIEIEVPRDKPRGIVLLSGGRLITERGDEVIDSGDILIRDNRIVAVGPHGTLAVPAGVRRIDLSGSTVLPGYVLTHEHIDGNCSVHVPRVWKYLLALAYGTTTILDPQSVSSADRFTYVDRVETGSLLGPRHISSGAAVQGQPIKTADEARDLTRRYSRFYDSHILKERGSGNRLLRQWVARTAFEERLTVVGHWQEDLISHVLDGYSGIEHASFVPWHEDMVQLVARSSTIYTPTTMVTSDGPIPLGYFLQQTDFTRESKLWRFAPRAWIEDNLLMPQISSWPLALKQGYAFKQEAEQAAKLVRAGGRVGVATDGSFLGLGAHWEMWALSMGGMSAAEVLRSATLTGAEAIGMDRDLGTIEAGKLADLQILDLNPLQDIHHTNSVHWVMKNGRLYDAETLDEVWPRDRPLVASEKDRPWWWDDLPPERGGRGLQDGGRQGTR